MTLSIGQQVWFGRKHGEQTRGIIEKINGKSIKIRQTEARGTHPVGTIWRVAPNFVQPISGTTLLIPQPAKRPEVDILSDITTCYCQLSPENLTCDGELSGRQVRARSREIHAKLHRLFVELGRVVSEDECWARELAQA